MAGNIKGCVCCDTYLIKSSWLRQTSGAETKTAKDLQRKINKWIIKIQQGRHPSSCPSLPHTHTRTWTHTHTHIHIKTWIHSVESAYNKLAAIHSDSLRPLWNKSAAQASAALKSTAPEVMIHNYGPQWPTMARRGPAKFITLLSRMEMNEIIDGN